MTPEAVLWPPKCTCTHRHTCTLCTHQHPRTPAHPCYRPARPLHSFAQEQVPYHQGPGSCVRWTLAKDSTFFHTGKLHTQCLPPEPPMARLVCKTPGIVSADHPTNFLSAFSQITKTPEMPGKVIY